MKRIIALAAIGTLALSACAPDRTDRDPSTGQPTVTGGQWVVLNDWERGRTFRCFLGPDHEYESPAFWCYEP